MFCTNCGSQISDSAAFCPNCGQKVMRPEAASSFAGTAPKIPVPQPRPEPIPQPAPQPSPQPAPNGQVRRPICNPEVQTKENILMGFFGALIGALLGGVVIVLFYKLDIIASLSGVALAFFTTWGYRKLGGRLSNTGLIISILLIAVVPYLAYRVDFAMEVAEAWGSSFGDVFKEFHNIIDMVDANSEFMSDMLWLYGFTALGAVGTVIDARKKQQTEDMQ